MLLATCSPAALLGLASLAGRQRRPGFFRRRPRRRACFAALHRSAATTTMVLTLFTTPGIPNPDLVHAYMAEVGIGDDKVVKDVVNVMAGENRSEEYVAKNPQGTVPALELEDGRVMAESTMICQYLDEVFGPTPLVGLTPEDRLETRMWINRIEENILIPMGEAFRFGHMYEFFKDRRPGTLIPEAVDGCKLSTATGIAWLEAQLGDGRDWLCGERFSLADQRLFVIYSFYSGQDKSMQAQDSPLFEAWLERCRGTPGIDSVAFKPKPKL